MADERPLEDVAAKLDDVSERLDEIKSAADEDEGFSEESEEALDDIRKDVRRAVDAIDEKVDPD
jgi:methyl-accepting chemotaxis protein